MGTSADSWRRAYSDGHLGFQQDQEAQEGTPGDKTKPPGRQDAGEPRKAACFGVWICEIRESKWPTSGWKSTYDEIIYSEGFLWTEITNMHGRNSILIIKEELPTKDYY